MAGREHELAAIRDAISQVSEGRPHAVIVSGESGVGKTRLIDEAVSEAGDEVRFLRGHCLPLGTRIPYLPMAELVRGVLRGMESGDIARIFGPAHAELARLMPEVREALGEPPERKPFMGSEDLERLRLFEALLRVAERVAQERLTVFVIEDAQWIDAASLELLSFLDHNIRRGRALLVLSVRAEALATNTPVLRFLADLERGPDVVRLELGRLDIEATRRQIVGILGEGHPSGEIERIWRLGDGNPLFTEELVAAAEDTGSEMASPRLRDLLGARSGRLPREAQNILRVAAAAGGSIDAGLLREAVAVDDADVERALASALDQQILIRTTDDPGRYRFRHELMRSVMAAQLDASHVERVHVAYAAALSARPPGRFDPSEVAFHWDAGGAREQALTAHVAAGIAVEERFAYASALVHYERALALWSDVADAEEVAGQTLGFIMLRGASSAARAGEFERAVELARKLIAEVEADEQLIELARSSLRWYLWEAGRPDEALAEARAAVQALRDDTPARWRANALAHLAGLLLVKDRVTDARARAEEALAIALAGDALDEQILASGVIGGCLFLQGDTDDGIERLSEALAAARRIEQHDRSLPLQSGDDRRFPLGVVLAYTQLTGAYELADRAEDAARTAEEGYAVAVSQGVGMTYGATIRAVGARALYRLGRWDEAVGVIETALHTGTSGSGRVGLLATRSLISIARGDASQADASIRAADDDVDPSTATDVLRWLAAARAEALAWDGRTLEAVGVVAAASGDPDPAARHAAMGQAIGLDASIPHLLALAARLGADLALLERSGSVEAMASGMALERVRDGIRRARRKPGLAAAWIADLAVANGELARAEHGAGPRAIRRWTAAVAATHGRPYLEAYARWRLAGALFGDPRRAAEAALELEHARTLSSSLRAARLVAAIDALGRSAGVARAAHGATQRAERPFGLTPREVEVLGLLAAGHGNKEIGARLFISPKTASVHISNIYGKLGVESRVAAATMALELGMLATEDGHNG